MKLTKNTVTRAEALKLCPDYVAFVEADFAKFQAVSTAFETVRKGTQGITAVGTRKQLVFVRVVVTSVNHDDPRALDGPVVRVGNDECTWRVDGDKYFFPYEKSSAKA